MNSPLIAPPDDLIGQRLAGRYEVFSKLGQGGMGAVYAARQAPLGRTVAIKVLLQELSGDPVATARFEKEALAISRLNHPNIVTIFDFGTTDAGLMYIVMEYLDGCSLRDLLRRETQLSPKRTVRIVMHIARALAEAHRMGIIHRDLKPDNIQLVTTTGEPDFVKVLDFGVAKLRRTEGGDSLSTLTQGNLIIGTPKYMSPEQINGTTDDPRTDLYALGIIAFECLTGQVPFDADNAVKILVRHLQDERPRLHDVNPECRASELLESLVEMLMARDAARRPPAAARLLELLEDLPEYTGPRSRTTTIGGVLPAAPPAAPNRPPPSRGSGAVLPPGVNLEGFHRTPVEPTGSFSGSIESDTGSVFASLSAVATPRDTVRTPPGPDEGETLLACPVLPPPDEDEPPGMATVATEAPAFSSTSVPGASATRPLPGNRTRRSQPKGPGLSLFVGAGLLAAGLGATSVVLWAKFARQPTQVVVSRPPDQPVRSTSVAPPSVPSNNGSGGAAASAGPPASASTTVPATVRINVNSQPPGATVLDGQQVLGRTPIDLTLTRSDQMRRFTLRLDGYKEITHALAPNADGEVTVKMEAEPSAERPRAEGQNKPEHRPKPKGRDKVDRSAKDRGTKDKGEKEPGKDRAVRDAPTTPGPQEPPGKSSSGKPDFPGFQKFGDLKELNIKKLE